MKRVKLSQTLNLLRSYQQTEPERTVFSNASIMKISRILIITQIMPEWCLHQSYLNHNYIMMILKIEERLEIPLTGKIVNIKQLAELKNILKRNFLRTTTWSVTLNQQISMSLLRKTMKIVTCLSQNKQTATINSKCLSKLAKNWQRITSNKCYVRK